MRRTERVAVTLAPGDRTTVALRGVPPDLVARLFPQSTRVDVELAIVAVRFADGRRWRVRTADQWIGRPDRRPTFRCLDAAGDVANAGDGVDDAGGVAQCQADGTLSSDAASGGGQ